MINTNNPSGEAGQAPLVTLPIQLQSKGVRVSNGSSALDVRPSARRRRLRGNARFNTSGSCRHGDR